MGKVYRATQRSLGRSVAVKALAKSWQRDAVAVDRFVEEARTLARLHHPNIVGVHGLGRFPGGGYFLVMDYVAGNTLESYRNSGSMTSAEAVSIVATLADVSGSVVDGFEFESRQQTKQHGCRKRIARADCVDYRRAYRV
ncbi:MAG: protein kinase [Planctomycetota bacterium]